ncbi:MAG: hypothetical protein AAB955_03385, partial [Patescibacteria group bacterium]
KLKQAGIVQLYSGKLRTISYAKWESLPGVSARIRIYIGPDGREHYMWCIKVPKDDTAPSQLTRARREMEEEAPSFDEAKSRLEYALSVLFPKEPCVLQGETEIIKERTSFMCNGTCRVEACTNVRFDFDVIKSANGKALTPPLALLEIEAGTEPDVLKCAEKLGITLTPGESVGSVSPLINERVGG